MNLPHESVIGVTNLCRATLVEVGGDVVLVERDAHDGESLECDLLETGARLSDMAVGDKVLIWRPDSEGERAVVVGRIRAVPRRTSGIAVLSNTQSDDRMDHLILEAKESLTLRVGDGSITIRADGKILIKGKDLVSHAQRVNRIKGGSVAIN